MADIGLIIKMPEEVYKSLINGKNYISYQEYVEEAIKNGTPFPISLKELYEYRDKLIKQEIDSYSEEYKNSKWYKQPTLKDILNESLYDDK